MTITVTDPVITAFSTVSEYLGTWAAELAAEPDLDRVGEIGKDDEAIQVVDQKEPLDLSPIARPTGELYHPRKLDDKLFGNNSDVRFICTAHENKMPVLLYGPPGTGKTALCEAALPNMVTVVGTAETEASDFTGSYVPTDKAGEYRWVDGPLLVAMEQGWPLFIDEIALIDSRELSVVYSVMDGRDKLPVTANPTRGTVQAKEGFMVFGACNPNVPGAIMSDALLSRFRVHIEVTTDWTLAKKLGVSSKAIAIARNLEKQYKADTVVAPPQLREVLTFRDVTKAFGEKIAVANFIAQARPEDRPAFIETVKSFYDESYTQGLCFG